MYRKVGTLILALLMVPVVGRAESRPDIIVVVTDDMRTSDWQALPQTQALLSDGTWLPNYIITTALCCPSRASCFTGLFAHNHGVHTNRDGWKAFRRWEDTALPTLLPDYHTALIGKYLNGYDANAAPPGWDTWEADRNPSYDWRGGYSTDVAKTLAVDLLRESTDPVFLWFAPKAPHNSSEDREIYAKRHASAFPEAEGLDRDRLRSLLAVDEAIVAMAAESPDAIWIIVSDNGWVFNEGGWTGKNVPYDGAHRVTALARMPGLAPGTDERIFANIDIFATVLTAAGYPVPANDGLAWQDAWHRDEIRIEGWNSEKKGIHYLGAWTPDGIRLDVVERHQRKHRHRA